MCRTSNTLFHCKPREVISLTTFLYRHKLTWHVDVQRYKKLHATIWQKLITVAKGKAKIEMSPFS